MESSSQSGTMASALSELIYCVIAWQTPVYTIFKQYI